MGWLGTGPFFGEKSCFVTKTTAENADPFAYAVHGLSPVNAPGSARRQIVRYHAEVRAARLMGGENSPSLPGISFSAF